MKLSNEAHQDLASDKPTQASTAAFALEAQDREQSKVRKRKPKADGTAPNPNVNVLRDWHRTEHARLRGAEPTYTSNQCAAAGKAWKDLLTVRSLDEAKGIITRALAESAGYHVDPWAILKAQNRYAGSATPDTRRRYEPQATTPALANLGREAGQRLSHAANLIPTEEKERKGAAQ
jgi:hypothetical protein